MATNDLHKSSAAAAAGCETEGGRRGFKAAVAAEPTNSIRLAAGVSRVHNLPLLI